MKLSVIIPNYNHGIFISEQITSILNQKKEAYEIIIIDDCSTDNSVLIIKKIIKKNKNFNIKLILNENNEGPLSVLNKGLLNSKGDYIYFPSADDRICDNLFFEASVMFNKYSSAGIFSALAYQMDIAGNFKNLISSPLISDKAVYLDPHKVKKYLKKYGFWIVGQTMIFKKECFTNLDLKFDVNLKHYSDIFVPLVIASKYGACFVPKTLASWRYYGGYAERNFANKENDFELFIKFRNLCNEPKYKDLIPKSFLDDLIKWKKILYINRSLNINTNNFLFKTFLKFFINLYGFRFNIYKTFVTLWSKRRYKKHYIIKDEALKKI